MLFLLKIGTRKVLPVAVLSLPAYVFIPVLYFNKNLFHLVAKATFLLKVG